MMKDWRFGAFIEAWRQSIKKDEPDRTQIYLSLALASQKSLPPRLTDLFKEEKRFARILARKHHRAISVAEVQDILDRVRALATKKPRFFPCSALAFEFVVTATDFCEFTLKKVLRTPPKETPELLSILQESALLIATCAINEQFGVSKEFRYVISRGRIPRAPGRRGFTHYCPDCKKRTAQKVLYSYVNHKIDPEIPTEYTLTECARCSQPALFMREDEGWGFIRGSDCFLWPGDARKNLGIVPFAASVHYKRASQYEEEGKWDATVLEVGRTLEAIVKDLEPKAKNLGHGLRLLQQQSIITADLFSWATGLRALRNLSAHASKKTFSEHEAENAFDCLDAIIEMIYWNRRQFRSLSSTNPTSDE